MAPKLAAFRDEITQNEKLFERIAAVYDARESAEARRPSSSAWPGSTTPTSCARARSSTRRPRSASSEINQRLASLYTNFSQNVLADEDGLRRWCSRRRPTSPACPSRVRAGAPPRPPRRAGTKGKWAITQHALVSVEPFLTYSDRRDLREKVWRDFVSRGDNGDAQRQQRDHHRDPEAARRAGQAARLRDPRALAPRERDGQDARARAWS